MTPTRFALLSTALPLLLCACAVQLPDPPSARSVSLTLAPGQKADVGGGMTLAYDSYSDSRCPKTVLCVWSGELLYRFTIASKGAPEAFAITLPNTRYVTRAGARIEIDPASVPPPPPPPDSAAAQYVLKLTVTRP